MELTKLDKQLDNKMNDLLDEYVNEDIRNKQAQGSLKFTYLKTKSYRYDDSKISVIEMDTEIDDEVSDLAVIDILNDKDNSVSIDVKGVYVPINLLDLISNYARMLQNNEM